MDRRAITSAIDTLKTRDRVAQGSLDELRDQLEVFNSSRDRHRQAWADDWHRAIVYCFVLFSRVGYLNKERREFLSPTKRAVVLTILLIIGVILEILVLAVALQRVDSTYAVPLGILILLFQLGYIVAKISKYESRRAESGFSLSCISCEYSLEGLDSVLGDQLWVGPAVCPECGQEYPAIFE